MIAGTLDMLILKALSLEPTHGFGIARRIEQTSRGVFKVNPGSLLTAFQRLERDGLVSAEWRQSDSGRRAKYYTLTRAGRRQLDVEIGIRIALGATRWSVTSLVLKEVLTLTGAGILAGLALAAALAASYVPARRAASVDPSQSLKVD